MEFDLVQRSACLINLDRLPSFWKGNCVFVSNILALFFGNKDQTLELEREVGAIETYGGRMIPVLDLLFQGGKNLLVLEKEPDEVLTRYYQSLGLKTPEVCELPRGFFESFAAGEGESIAFADRLKRHTAGQLTGFVTDAALGEFSRALGKELIGSVEGCRKGNNKYLLHQHLEYLGLPIFDTCEAKDAAGVLRALDVFRGKGYRYAVMKSQIGASGIGIRKFNLAQTISTREVPDYMFYEGPVLVQGWLDQTVKGVEYIASPSLQLFVGEQGCKLYALTEQILSRDGVHEGNVSPPPCVEVYPEIKAKMLRQAELLAGWLTAQGYIGTASIDYHAIRRDNQTEVRVCEINARVTGATYPAVLAKHFLPEQYWLMRNVRFSNSLKGETILAAMHEHSILFDKAKERGILPFNFNTDSQGRVIKGQFLFMAEDRAGLDVLVQTLQKTMTSFGGYDRD